MEENESKKTWVFAIRMVLFTVFACVLPFSFIAWRYNLFFKLNSVSITGWGMIAIIILFIFVIYVLKTLKKGLHNKRKWSMWIQVIDGILKVIAPLLAIYFVVNAIQDSIAFFKQSLYCTIICECIAIPINPLPKWEIESLKEGEEDRIESVVEKAKKIWKGE